MYRSQFEIEDNMEETKDLVLDKTIKTIESLQKKFNEEVFSSICDDVETWMFERFENVRRRYFDGIVSYLLDEDYRCITKVEPLEKWLAGLGYEQQSFRKKIYLDNKEEINNAIACDAVYQLIENMFVNNYFKSWEFKDITRGYPQTEIIKGFLKELISKDGFNEEVKNMLDNEINQKILKLKNLKEELSTLQEKIDSLVS